MAAEFSRRTEGLLNQAHKICQQRGVTLTNLRRRILGLILDTAVPIGAYELLDQLREERRGAAPPTVYRTLDFLLEQGLIHKLERLSAFVGCVAGCTIGSAADGHEHAAQFMICRICGRVIEMQNHDVSAALAKAALRSGFVIKIVTVEAEGLCKMCLPTGKRSAVPYKKEHPRPRRK